jgi:hypothetical protein
MHRYATALAMALITMLTLAVSASLTPGNAAGGGFAPYCGARINGAAGYQMCYRCTSQCYGPNFRNLAAERCYKPGPFCDPGAIPPRIVACMAACVNASEATRHKSRQ